jgi:hypothetical protein
MRENREVLIAVFQTFRIGIFRITTSAAGRADPTTYAIGRQRIVVPGEFALGGGDPFDSAANVFAQPTIAPIPISYLAAVHTKIAYDALGMPWRLSWKPPFASNPPMNL